MLVKFSVPDSLIMKRYEICTLYQNYKACLKDFLDQLFAETDIFYLFIYFL
jgi:hypothetical protein